MSFPFQVAQTFIENWPEGVQGLAPASVSLKLAFPDAVSLGSYSRYFREQMGVESGLPLSDELTHDIANALVSFPEGVMPRIGYCSWKDSSLLNAPARTVRDVMSIISRDDDRIARALVAHTQTHDEVYLHLRSWRTIQPFSEFRIFIKNRRFAGASQYAHAEVYEDIQSAHKAIGHAIAQLSEELIAQLHIDDVVADVFVDFSSAVARAVLIELNPFDPRTDSCLFDWRVRGDFDGRLRFRDPIGRVVGLNPS
jgi:D123